MHLFPSATDLPLLPLSLVLIGLIFIESDAVIVFIGILIHQHIVPLYLGLSIALTAGLANDYLWYRLGRHIRTKDHPTVAWIERVTRRANVHVQAHPFKAIFLTKFMYGIIGIHRATLIRCGMNKLSYKHFFIYNGISVIVWVAALVAFGYFGTRSVAHVSHVVRMIELTVLLLIVLTIALWKLKKAWTGPNL